MGRKIHKSIRGGNPDVRFYIKEVWQSRQLIFNFAKRDLKVQYAQTYLGILWSLIQPLTGLVIFTLFFQKLIPLPVAVPYPVFAFTGIMGWFYFSGIIAHAGTSLMHNDQIIKKIYFPRLVLPLSKALTGLVEFLISLVLLLCIVLFSGIPISPAIIFLPFVVIANIICGLSIAVWLAALTIRFRDLHHIIPYLIGFGIWLTPVFYPVTIVPPNVKWLYYVHPVANVIALYRWIFIGLSFDPAPAIVSLLLSFVIFIAGLWYFIRNEKFIADHL